MSVQDRNIHRDALALQRSVNVEMFIPTEGVDQDEPMWHVSPRYNWRLSDLSSWNQGITGNVPLTITAQALPLHYALGSPRCLPNPGQPTVLIDDYWDSILVNGIVSIQGKLTVPDRGFAPDGIATVLDGFWGVWLWMNESVGGTQQQAFAAAPVMSFGTEEIALANCPKVRDLNNGRDQGRLCILTVHAVGGDFIAGTTNTDAALVAAFNTAPQVGHVITIPAPIGRPQAINAVLGQQLKDASGTNLLQGKGGPEGDALVVMTKCFGGPVPPLLVGPAQATVSYRPWPVGGEGLGDVSVSQTRSEFVP